MNDQELTQALRRTSRTLLFSESVASGAFAAGVAIITCLLAIGLDAALALPPWGLAIVDGVILTVMLAAFVYLTWTAHRNRFRPRRVARLIENRLGLIDSRLINAVDLAAGAAGDTSGALREVTIARGSSFAATVAGRSVCDLRRVRKAIVIMALTLVLAATTAGVFPKVFGAVIPRLLRPWAAHPPFTLVEFEVSIEPEKIFQGGEAVIKASLQSATGLPRQANVIFLDEQFAPAQSLPMQRVGDGLFSLRVSSVSASRTFYIDTEAGRSKRYLLKVHQVPTFRRVTLQYNFPSYTRWPASTTAIRPGGQIRAIEGTEVTLTAESHSPLKAGWLVLNYIDASRDALEVPLAVHDSPNTVTGRFTLTGSGGFKLRLIGPENVEDNEDFRGAFSAAPDELPTVSIVEPAPSLIVPADWKVNVVIEATDDVAVDRILLYRGVNGWGPTPTELALQKTTPTYATAVAVFDLPALGAQAGDIITYYASAYDVYPGSSHYSDTATQVIRVISPEEYLQYVRQRYRMEEMMAELIEFQQRFEDLAEQRGKMLDELEKLQQDVEKRRGEWTDADKQKLDELAAAQAKYAEGMKQLASDMKKRINQPNVWDMEDEYKETLRSTAIALENQAMGNETVLTMLKQMKSDGLTGAEAARHAANAISQLQRDGADSNQPREDMEKSKKELELLAKADELTALVEAVQSLAGQQRELADRLGQFRNAESLNSAEQIRARRMAKQQAQLKDELKSLVAQMHVKAKEHGEALPKMSASVSKLAKAIDELEVSQDQQEAAQLAAAGQGRYAHTAADSAATKLESLIGTCCPNPNGTAMEDIDVAIGMKKVSLSNTLKQLGQSRGIPGFGQGGQGGGSYGTRADVRLGGPHQLGGRGDADRGSGDRGTGRGNHRPYTHDGKARGKAEDLGSEVRDNRGQRDVRNMPGVPPRYRNLAEAYFRRLADESK